MNARFILVALPPVVVTLGLGFFAGAELSGARPLTWGEPRSVAEAIAMRDGASAARFVEDGAAVDEIGLIRGGMLSPQPVLATPLEAAVMVDAAAIFDYLVSRGAHVKPDVSCLARDIGARAVRSRIASAPACPPGAALQAVLDRP